MSLWLLDFFVEELCFVYITNILCMYANYINSWKNKKNEGLGWQKLLKLPKLKLMAVLMKRDRRQLFQ